MWDTDRVVLIPIFILLHLFIKKSFGDDGSILKSQERKHCRWVWRDLPPPPPPRVSPTVRKLGNGFNSFKAVALQSWKAAAGRCGNEFQDHNGVRSSVVEVWSVCSWDLGRQCSIYPPQFPSWPSLRLHSHYTSGPCLPGGLYLLSAFPCVDPPHLPRISTRHLPNTHIFLFLIVFTYIAPSDWQGVGWGWQWGIHVQRNMFSCSHWLCKKQSISLPTCYCPQ